MAQGAELAAREPERARGRRERPAPDVLHIAEAARVDEHGHRISVAAVDCRDDEVAATVTVEPADPQRPREAARGVVEPRLEPAASAVEQHRDRRCREARRREVGTAVAVEVAGRDRHRLVADGVVVSGPERSGAAVQQDGDVPARRVARDGEVWAAVAVQVAAQVHEHRDVAARVRGHQVPPAVAVHVDGRDGDRRSACLQGAPRALEPALAAAEQKGDGAAAVHVHGRELYVPPAVAVDVADCGRCHVRVVVRVDEARLTEGSVPLAEADRGIGSADLDAVRLAARVVLILVVVRDEVPPAVAVQVADRVRERDPQLAGSRALHAQEPAGARVHQHRRSGRARDDAGRGLERKRSANARRAPR